MSRLPVKDLFIGENKKKCHPEPVEGQIFFVFS
jgi:hypothetical protein